MMDELLKYKAFATHSVAAAGSVALGTAITYPFDTIKVIVQVASGPNTQVTATQAFTTVTNLSGYSGLFRGFGWLAFGRILGTGTRFGTYELMTAYFKDGRPRNEIYASEALIAGTACGAAESLIASPFEILKLRSQATSVVPVPSHPSAKTNGVVSPPVIQKLLRGHTPDMKSLNHSANLLSVLSSKPQNLTGALQAYPWMMTGSGSAPPVTSVRKLSEIVSLEGWSALWRGLRPGLVRDSVYGGFFFTTWHFMHQALLDWKAVNMVPVPSLDADVGPLPPLNISLAAGFSGLVAAAASHCFDTAKSRQLCCVMPKFVSLERKLLELKPAGTRFERWTGIHPFDRKVLYNGIWLRMARCGIGSFLIVRCYFFAVDQLVSRGNMLT